jgi:2-aminoadipate transaminase
MLSAMDKFFPKEVKWTHPEGGLFLWVECPKEVDTTDMVRDAIGMKVAYVGGTGFYPDGRGENCMRLNFSYSTPEVNREGIRRLAECLKKRLSH